MTRTNKIIIGLACLLGATAYVRYDVWALELAHQNGGRQADCAITRIDGERWAACRYGAGGSLWVRHGNGWAAVNGKAKQLAQAVARTGNRGGATLYGTAGDGRTAPEGLRGML